jgi:crotonobetainyl-CoA:carnitine CoA-transferase CaiB-like acyl-CoA transferase
MRITIDDPQHGPIDVIGFPIKFGDAPCRVHRPPPMLGADTEAVLAELGRSAQDVDALRAANVI